MIQDHCVIVGCHGVEYCVYVSCEPVRFVVCALSPCHRVYGFDLDSSRGSVPEKSDSDVAPVMLLQP